jgi:undecaprenol kinase
VFLRTGVQHKAGRGGMAYFRRGSRLLAGAACSCNHRGRMSESKNRSFTARLGFALNGWREAWRREHSFRTQAIVGALTLPVLLVLRPSAIWWALVGTIVAVVLALELMNSALETLIDHVHPGLHPQIKIVKDMAAAAVLTACAGAAVVGGVLVLSAFVG